ncbi:hypothetical protein L596_003230 [Steinernema carpocapsae]|uniref:FYVE-type domain-containing protein n=1 Tax=Steinernema carpocapsae TaxID=34508 RepID=A0A4U8UUT2_STECR|nr:hypothetical protein L596_003230 [Steinernema carpocapsae]
MQSLRKLVRKPRVDDWSPLAKFYYADEALNNIAGELDSFDGRRDPERCNQLVTKLRQAQDRLLHIVSEMLVIVFPHESDRACRDYRIKFPDEVVHDNLPGQLWFGAECLAAGSNIIDHETESDAIRPIARELTKHLDQMRELLKDQALRDPAHYPEKIKQSLRSFDHLFADFELRYVSAMVPVKSVKEHDCQLDVAVLFSESLERALKLGYFTQENIDDCDPNVMIAIPRLAIVWGLLYYPDGALNVDGLPENLSEMFRPFHHLLLKIRNLLLTLTQEELKNVEGDLCSGNSGSTDVFECNDSTTYTMADFTSDKREVLGSSASLARSVSATLSSSSQEAGVRSSDNITSSGGENSSAMTLSEESRSDLRSRFRSSKDLVHRLFVCIAGVADQLQTNYSSDVRKVLKMVLQPNEIVPVFEVSGQTAEIPENEEETGVEVQETLPLPAYVGVRWVPDSDCEQCTACQSPFTIVRRRHHCRNCGRIFCARCSANSLNLPELGYDRKVRVCNLCFLYKINPFSQCGNGDGPPANSAASSSGPAQS